MLQGTYLVKQPSFGVGLASSSVQPAVGFGTMMPQQGSLFQQNGQTLPTGNFGNKYTIGFGSTGPASLMNLGTSIAGNLSNQVPRQ